MTVLGYLDFSSAWKCSRISGWLGKASGSVSPYNTTAGKVKPSHVTFVSARAVCCLLTQALRAVHPRLQLTVSQELAHAALEDVSA